MKLQLLLFVCNPFFSCALSCGRYVAGENISFITKRELEECLPLFGRNPIDKTFAWSVWRTIKNIYHDVDGVPLSIFKNMGWTLSGIYLDDLQNMTIDQAELIQMFGSAESLSDEQMEIIAEKVKSDWASKTPENYSEYDLKILGKILCYFNESEILKIHADAYRAAAKAIGKLTSCPKEVIQSFAKLAVQPQAFGSPSKWSKLDISELGVTIAGLPDTEYDSIKTENLMQSKRIYNQISSSRHPNQNATAARSLHSSSKNNAM